VKPVESQRTFRRRNVFPETSVEIQWSTWRYIPDIDDFINTVVKNFKFHKNITVANIKFNKHMSARTRKRTAPLCVLGTSEKKQLPECRRLPSSLRRPEATSNRFYNSLLFVGII
jgi:hypothetical protein